MWTVRVSHGASLRSPCDLGGVKTENEGEGPMPYALCMALCAFNCANWQTKTIYSETCFLLLFLFVFYLRLPMLCLSSH